MSNPLARVWSQLGDSHSAAPSPTQPKPKRKHKRLNLPGGYKAIFAFCLSLVAYTLQTEFAQYVQQGLNYRKPLLSLYLGHSGFLFLLPMHLLVLRYTTNYPLSHWTHLIALNLRWQLSSSSTPPASLPSPSPDQVRRRLSSTSGRSRSSQHPLPQSGWIEQQCGFDALKLFNLFAILAVGVFVPALAWYSAVPMTSMADITAIYNTFSMWALVFSVWFLGEKWQKRKVFSVLLACFGVVIVAYGGADHRKQPKQIDPEHGKPPAQEDPIGAASVAALLTRRAIFLLSRDDAADDNQSKTPTPGFTNPMLGNILALVGAITMAGYEMIFKLIGTLPDEPRQNELYSSTHRRATSYIQHHDHPHGQQALRLRDEEQGLLDHESEPQHVIADADQEDERAAIYTKPSDSEPDPQSYQTIVPSPPPEAAIHDAHQGSKEEQGKPDKAGGSRIDVRTVPVPTNDQEDDVTESELEDGEEEEIRHGATKLHRTRSDLSTRRRSSAPDPLESGIPPPLPFGLHANIMTSGIGLVTFACLWIGLPIADALGWEPFEMPHNLWTVLSIATVVVCGIFFNGAFMILLSLWGPVLASVSCLMTTILVEIADVLLGNQLKLVSVIGCTFIAAGFAVLVGGDGH